MAPGAALRDAGCAGGSAAGCAAPAAASCAGVSGAGRASQPNCSCTLYACWAGTVRQLSMEPVGQGAMQAMQALHTSARTT